MSRVSLPLSLLLALGMLALARPAAAAPQILALLKTPAPMPFACDGGTCRVEMTALCLQRHRKPPTPGTAYRAHEPNDLHIVTAAGKVRRLADIPGARIASLRSYTAIEVSVPRAAIGKGAALTVADDASIVPLPVAGDPDPLSKAEIAYVTGPLRVAAGRALASARAMRDHHAAALLSRLVNATPSHGRLAQATREKLWHDVATPHANAYGPGAVERSRQIYRSCMIQVDQGWVFSMRECLEGRQDDLMLNINPGVWRATDPGS